MTKEEEEELRAYISRMEADNAFKDAKIRRLEGELRIAESGMRELTEQVQYLTKELYANNT